MTVTSTREELQEILERMQGKVRDYAGTSCRRCQELASAYDLAINQVVRAEATYNNSNENSPAERSAKNFVAIRVRLECTTARRFILHVLKDHNR